MNRIFRSVLFAAIAFIAANSFLSGCKAPCTYPDQNAVKIRIFNAMPDENVISIFINGRLFAKDFPYDPRSTFIHDGASTQFGYLSTYDDGAPLIAGSSIPVVVTSDAAGKDTIMKTTVTLDFHLQSLIIMGKGHTILPTDPATRKILHLDDDLQPNVASKTFIRFVHSVPDLPALDIYWSNKADGTPDATINYGIENSYIDLTNANSLKITEAGNPTNVIFFSPYKPVPIPGLVLTTIVRGESKPYGSDHIVSVFILSDGTTFGGFVYDFSSFGVRFINASRSLNLNLLILGNQDSLPRLDYPNQKIVEFIGPDSITEYLPLMQKFDDSAKFWFAADLNFPAVDTFIRPGFRAPFPLTQDHRYSIIAVENKKLGETGRSLDTLILIDSMTSQPNMGRVRVVNLSPDHGHISFALGGKSKTLTKKQYDFFDVPPGATTITLDDGTVQRSVMFTVPSRIPISLYLMPATTTDAYPIKTSED